MLSNTQLDDDGAKYLSGFTGLKKLLLSGTRIGDKGVASLKGLKSLEVLQLEETQVSDEGLKSLEQMGELQSLISIIRRSAISSTSGPSSLPPTGQGAIC